MCALTGCVDSSKPLAESSKGESWGGISVPGPPRKAPTSAQSPLFASHSYLTSDPPKHPILNSITDNPVQGDEHNFFQVKNLESPSGAYSDTVVLHAGRTYEGFVYFDNDARSSSKKGELRAADLDISLPKFVLGSDLGLATIEAGGGRDGPYSYARSEILLSSPNDITTVDLAIVPGSFMLHTMGAANGATLKDNGSYVLLGCDAVNGVLAPSSRCSGYVTFEFAVTRPGATASTTSVVDQTREENDLVPNQSSAGETFSSGETSIDASPGDVISVSTTYKNTGKTKQTYVGFRVRADSGLTILHSSVQYERDAKVFNLVVGDEAPPASSNLFWVTNGFDYLPDATPSGFAPGAESAVTYEVQVDSTGNFTCGNRWLAINGFVLADDGTIPSQLIVNVDGAC
jgi:hypothetical protein